MSKPASHTFSIAAFCLAAATLGFTGCSQNLPMPGADTSSISPSLTTQSGDEKTRSVKIALLLPTGASGEAAQIARSMKQAAELALFEANDPAIQLIPKDDGGTPEGAARAAEAAVGEGAEIILGPLLGKSVSGAAPIAAKAGVPILAFSNDPTVVRPGVFLLSFMARDEVSRVISYATQQGIRRYAALIPSNAYGQSVEAAFRAAIADAGAEIVSLKAYAPEASSILSSTKSVLQVIADADRSGRPVDALFVPAGADTISDLSTMLAYAGIDSRKVRLIGTSAWDLPAMSRDDKLLGGWYAAPDPQSWSAFASKYQKTFGTEPPRLASLAYDAMGIALQLAAAPAPQRYEVARLTRAEGFSGVDGPVRFAANGLPERNLAVLEIQKYRSVVLDAAKERTVSEQVSRAGASLQ